jgi:hypothetical protein
MAVKVLMTWDISPEHEQEYFEFVIGEWIPGIQRLGLEPVEAWATIYGNYPQIQVAMLAPDLPDAQRIFNTTDWTVLRSKLFNYVRNYSSKVVDAKSSFQF